MSCAYFSHASTKARMSAPDITNLFIGTPPMMLHQQNIQFFSFSCQFSTSSAKIEMVAITYFERNRAKV
jgi:hypothetical protein